MTLSQFMELNRDKGFHWFSKDAMRFFKSRISYSSWDFVTGYFITSERNGYENPRRFTIRKANFETGGVDTIGEFQEFASLNGAKAKLKRLL